MGGNRRRPKQEVGASLSNKEEFEGQTSHPEKRARLGGGKENQKLGWINRMRAGPKVKEKTTTFHPSG